jgi:DNA-binding MarR family transcriptional regulator
MIDERDHASGTGAAAEELPVATSICNAIIWMSHLIDRYANARLASFGLSPALTMPRVRLLLAVASGSAEQASTRMSDIALDVGVTARTITTMVDALEREGLVERVPDPLDRRAISLVLTDAGEAAVPRLREALDEICAAVMAPLSQTTQEAMQEVLTRLIERDAE